MTTNDRQPQTGMAIPHHKPLRSARQAPTQRSKSIRPLRAAVAIWIGYLLVLFVADYAATRNGTGLLPIPYYIVQLLTAFVVLALAGSARAPLHLGRLFWPLVILIISVVPLVATAATVPYALPGPLFGVGGTIVLRALPMMTIAVVLTAWQYRMRQVVLVCLAAAALFATLDLRASIDPLKAVTRAAVEAMGMLVIGYCVCLVMDKLRTQQASLEHANRQLRHYASTLEQLAISCERNRVARELHDTLSHTLSGLIVQLEAIKAYAEIDQPTASTMIRTALDNARSGLQETRLALKALRASPLDDLGLQQALHALADQARSHLQVDAQIASSMPPLASDVEQCIYRVAQEAIANVTQHANATLLRIQLTLNHDLPELVIEDDGRGFIRHAIAPEGHFGLIGMEERAALCDGQLTVVSAPGAGTTITLSF
jgi:signal transduction histidine kinase